MLVELRLVFFSVFPCVVSVFVLCRAYVRAFCQGLDQSLLYWLLKPEVTAQTRADQAT